MLGKGGSRQNLENFKQRISLSTITHSPCHMNTNCQKHRQVKYYLKGTYPKNVSFNEGLIIRITYFLCLKTSEEGILN